MFMPERRPGQRLNKISEKFKISWISVQLLKPTMAFKIPSPAAMARYTTCSDVWIS